MYVVDTPDLGVEFCPACDPQDIFEHRSDGRVWVVRFHGNCQPTWVGVADDEVPNNGSYLSGTSESEGHTNRLVQALIT